MSIFWTVFAGPSHRLGIREQGEGCRAARDPVAPDVRRLTEPCTRFDRRHHHLGHTAPVRLRSLVSGLWSLVFFVAALGAGFPAPVHAQSAAPLVRFTVFAAKPIANVTFVPRDNAEPRKLTFYPTARSPRYEYRGAMPLRFTDAESGEVVAEASIPPNITEALLLLSPAAKDGAGAGLRYRVAVLDDSPARQGAGTLAIINLSGLMLAGTVNGRNVTLQSGLNPTFEAGRGASVVLRTDFKGRSYQSYSGTITLGASQRALLLLFPPFYAGSLEVQSRVLVDSVGAVRR